MQHLSLNIILDHTYDVDNIANDDDDDDMLKEDGGSWS